MAVEEAGPSAVQVQSEAPVRIAGGSFSRTFTVDVSTYVITQEVEGGITYDVFSVPGGYMDTASGYPMLPFVRGYTLTLPFSATLSSVNLLGTVSQTIGTYQVPILNVKPWSEGGTTYTTTTSVNYPYPSQLVAYQQTSDGVLFTLAPIQHNPASGQTWFTSRFTVEVSYEAPIEIAIPEFSTEKATYAPGETVNTQARIANVGDNSATLTASLQIDDLLGQSMGSRSAGTISIPAGGSQVLAASWDSVLPDGAYLALLTLWQNGSVVAASATSFQVLGGAITGIGVPSLAIPGRPVTFTVDFANYRPSPVTAQLTLTVRTSEGTAIAELAAQGLNVGANSSATAVFVWTPGEVPGGTYSVMATAAVGGQAHGPDSEPFNVAHQVYLPVSRRALQQ